ncbi:MerR family transcriptional regulator [Kribbella sp. NPDC056861]|uniref:MerR family transcriptional regulator n=1 Tax=Kribbella sp. NPDC056861 TaxID=3154857 RepID=UPI00343852DB
MNELFPIGDLARHTGLTVKAIRHYSDLGLVPPTDRSPAGYRRYDLAAIARLDLIRSLRELGFDLGTIRQVLDREIALSDVAAAHAEALAIQIQTLRLRRAILTAVAERGSTPEELKLMHRLVRLSETERQHLLDDFLDNVFGSDPLFAGLRQTLTAQTPGSPNHRAARSVDRAGRALPAGRLPRNRPRDGCGLLNGDEPTQHRSTA